MRLSSSSDEIASARISFSDKSLNFLSIGTPSSFVEEENRINGGKKSPKGRKCPVAQPLLAVRFLLCSLFYTNPLNQKPLCPAKMHNSKSISCTNFMLHPVKMIFHRLLRQAELVRNFFVRQSLRDQRNDLLLAPRQAQPGMNGCRMHR